MERSPDQNAWPQDIKRLEGEELIEITTYPSREPQKTPSTLAEMLRLTRVSQSHEIGDYGPALASLALIEDEHTPEHLRLYTALFGRDALYVADDLLPSHPKLARATILTLAGLQGTEYNSSREEEPGRIVHEARGHDDPIAKKLTRERGWDWPYYGSVDATPKFIRVLAKYCQLNPDNQSFLSESYTAKNGETRLIADSLASAIGWVIKRCETNPEGLLEYQTTLPHGIENQVWKDSWDAYHHEDGTIANHSAGIASIEVQVSTYDALLDAAQLLSSKNPNDTVHINELMARAEELKQAIFEYFWCEEKGGYFVLGTDRDEHSKLRQLRIRTSNMGHVLNSRLLEGNDPATLHYRNAVVRQLFTPELLNISGIRTLASDEVRFRPGAYHNGSVWLWDTYHIAKGLRLHGYNDEAQQLEQRLLTIPQVTGMFPEFVRGDDLDQPSLNTRKILIWDSLNRRENVLEQPPQEVQAWTVAAILAIKRQNGNQLGP